MKKELKWSQKITWIVISVAMFMIMGLLNCDKAEAYKLNYDGSRASVDYEVEYTITGSKVSVEGFYIQQTNGYSFKPGETVTIEYQMCHWYWGWGGAGGSQQIMTMTIPDDCFWGFIGIPAFEFNVGNYAPVNARVVIKTTMVKNGEEVTVTGDSPTMCIQATRNPIFAFSPTHNSVDIQCLDPGTSNFYNIEVIRKAVGSVPSKSYMLTNYPSYRVLDEGLDNDTQYTYEIKYYSSFNTSYPIIVDPVTVKTESNPAVQAAREAASKADAAMRAAVSANNAALEAKESANRAAIGVWDSTENKSAAQLAKEARDRVINLEQVVTNIPPIINSIKGIDGATCTKTGEINLVLDTSGARKQRIKVGNGNWGNWHDATNQISAYLGNSGVHTIYIEVSSSNTPSESPSSIARASIVIFKI